jgi:hypothetical protein
MVGRTTGEFLSKKLLAGTHLMGHACDGIARNQLNRHKISGKNLVFAARHVAQRSHVFYALELAQVAYWKCSVHFPMHLGKFPSS